MLTLITSDAWNRLATTMRTGNYQPKVRFVSQTG